MSKRAPKDYVAQLRELRQFVRGFEARDGFKLDAKSLDANDKRAITRAHKALADRRLDAHVVYRAKDRAKVKAVQRAFGEPHPERYKVAFVSTPLPERTRVKVSGKGARTKVATVIEAPKVGRRKAKRVAYAFESRDWSPERLLLDPQAEVRRITAGDGPRTKYVFKTGQFVGWRMGFPVGRVALLDQVRAFVNTYGAASRGALKDWATGVWAFKGSDAEFNALIAIQRTVRQDVRKVRQRAKRIAKQSRRARVTGRR